MLTIFLAGISDDQFDHRLYLKSAIELYRDIGILRQADS